MSVLPAEGDSQRHQEQSGDVSVLPLSEQLRLYIEKGFSLAGVIRRDSPTSHLFVSYIDIIAAPNIPAYSADGLNAAQTMVQDTFPAGVLTPEPYRDVPTGLVLGKLTFDEIIAYQDRRIQRVNTPVQAAEFEKIGIKNQDEINSRHTLVQRTFVRFYPDSRIATLVAQYEQQQEDEATDSESPSRNLKRGVPAIILEALKRGDDPAAALQGTIYVHI